MMIKIIVFVVFLGIIFVVLFGFGCVVGEMMVVLFCVGNCIVILDFIVGFGVFI